MLPQTIEHLLHKTFQPNIYFRLVTGTTLVQHLPTLTKPFQLTFQN